MFAGFRSFMLSASWRRLSIFANCGSAVSDSVVAVSTPSRAAGLSNVPAERTFLTIEERNACWRLIREVSDPSPNVLRARTNASASSPAIVWLPALSLRPLSGSLTGSLKQISTPPTASVIALNPPKSITMKLSIAIPVMFSTALSVQPGPPRDMASLNFPVPPLMLSPLEFLHVGRSIRVSRGMLTAIASLRSALTCNRIVVSERSAVPNLAVLP